MPADAATMKRNKRRGLKVVAVAAALVVAGGAAFAYWTAGGSGSGSADDRHNQRRHGHPDTLRSTALYPGGARGPLSRQRSTTPTAARVHVATVTV